MQKHSENKREIIMEHLQVNAGFIASNIRRLQLLNKDYNDSDKEDEVDLKCWKDNVCVILGNLTFYEIYIHKSF